MKTNQSNIICSLSSAIYWSSHAIWASEYPSMQDNTLNNIQRALEDIAEAESLLKQMKEDLLNK
jgi:hypothetical protein